MEYRDRVLAEEKGRRRVEREWAAVDACGNRDSRVQRISVGNWEYELSESFKNFLAFSFGRTELNDSWISGW